MLDLFNGSHSIAMGTLKGKLLKAPGNVVSHMIKEIAYQSQS